MVLPEHLHSACIVVEALIAHVEPLVETSLQCSHLSGNSICDKALKLPNSYD